MREAPDALFVRRELRYSPRSACVAQLDRASVFETEGRWFESNRVRLTGHSPDSARSVARECIAAVERALAASADTELAKAVTRLSDLYTSERGKLTREQASVSHLVAKSEYFLASDAPKIGLALTECAARSAAFARLSALDTIRVTDLGAGVGATSVGFMAWLAGARAASGLTNRIRIELHAIELGEPAARAFERSVQAAAEHCGFDLALRIEAKDFRGVTVEARDLILCQTALNELLIGDTHSRETAAMVARWATAAPLLVIEPALKTTTRALMMLRDALLALGGMHVVAPCLHQQRCPMLAREGDWCHEARRIEPTPRVLTIDKLVGRRDERALFAFLACAPAAVIASDARVTMRIVTDTLGSRGKTERLVCRSDGEMRMMRLLDREVSESNALFLKAKRGDTLEITPIPDNDRIAVLATVQANIPQISLP